MQRWALANSVGSNDQQDRGGPGTYTFELHEVLPDCGEVTLASTELVVDEPSE